LNQKFVGEIYYLFHMALASIFPGDNNFGWKNVVVDGTLKMMMKMSMEGGQIVMASRNVNYNVFGP
jgi:hypothetical protein